MTADELADRIARGERWKVEESKPVGYVYQNELEGMELGHYPTTELFLSKSIGRIPVYAAPKKREWVGLTMDDIAELRRAGAHTLSDRDAFAVAQKLKEKNV